MSVEKNKKIKEFIEFWKDKGYEKGQSQTFWLTLLRDILGVESPEKYITFEDKVMMDNTSFIDGYIDSTHVLIEQKSVDKDLRKAIKQSDGSFLTPFQQAKRYSAELPYDKRPRWIITCNFKEFFIYDMNKPNGEPEVLLLKNLLKESYRLEFVVNKENENIKKEMEISIKAGEIVGVLYDALLKQYNEKDEHEMKSLNELCVRLVFCLYAEDSDLFGKHLAFHDYLAQFKAKDARRALIDLFKVLDTKLEERDPYMDEELAKFPYVNGGLFANENIIIPQLTDEILDIILHKASEDFDWSEISPTIFGAVFESTLNPETRRSGGMHYTSIENIHKVIDPLFLDELKQEFVSIKETKVLKDKKAKLAEFKNKIAGLNFLDPACGSGNFLTETYISLRRLENEILKLEIDLNKYLAQGQILIGLDDTIKVSIKQFYGIEINDFAVTVAKTALWISEAQMLQETEALVNHSIEFFPLKSYANIVEANALRIDWNDVIPKEKCNYIMGNPPFVGAKLMNEEQRREKYLIWGETGGKLDYVSCWYKKSTDFIINTSIRCALVSTNSITQGEQPAILWSSLFKNSVHIDFAYRTFIWDSEAKVKAHVYCVIIGFSIAQNNKSRIIYYNDRYQIAKNINAYLLDADVTFLDKRRFPICNVPEMTKGSQLIDGGNFIFNTIQEKEEFVQKYPEAKPYIFEYCNADSFLNNREKKFCLYLDNCPLNIIRNSKGLIQKVTAVYEFRKNSNALTTKALQYEPYKFFIANIPKGRSILFPVVSSERRKYIPIGYLKDCVIYTNATNYIDEATLYHFGILTSNVHMAWMRVVCGRLKSDYRYSKDIVYNNFPWPTPTKEQKQKIEQTAQAILDARAKFPDCSLADLYDEVTMPPALRKAHQENDKAVMQAYGFWGKVKTESECVAELMKMYKKLTESKK